ncbi:GtrA family protein [uncultured Megasphaera sp.]|uniref:GtrA family protein n=1 Tax=uncultured Megasphaera sp. TaxID=165188 RepID=UPI00265A5FD6|nr:GtrA family protein [uncultured Megasphaera sp.]
MKQKKIFGFDYTQNEYVKIGMYLLVGGSAALLEWALFYLFFQGLTAGGFFPLQTHRVLTATTLAFGTSTLYHYILCNRFVFDSGSRYQKGTEISLVFLVSAIGLGWNLLLMWLFTSPVLLGLNPMVSKILASAIVTVWNYLSRKKWIFK